MENEPDLAAVGDNSRAVNGKAAEQPYALESVLNASKVLLMLRSTSDLRVVDVAAEVGVARSTAHRLLNTLCASGLLEKDEVARSYQAGPALVEIGLKSVGVFDLRAEARPVVQRLAEETGETVHVITLQAPNVLFLDGVEGGHVIRAVARTGLLRPAHTAAAGKVLLAELSAAELRETYSPPSPENRRILQALEKELDLVRVNGYATNFSESEPDLHAVSVGVHDRRGRLRAALSVSAPSYRLPEDRVQGLAAILRAGAAELGLRL